MFPVKDKALDTRFGLTWQIAPRMSMVDSAPHPPLVCGVHSSPDCWRFTPVFPGLIFFGDGFSNFDLACSRPVPFFSGPVFDLVSGLFLPLTLFGVCSTWVQSQDLVNLRIKHQLLLWAFTGPDEPNLWTTEGHTWIPGVLGAVQDQQHSGSHSYETPLWKSKVKFRPTAWVTIKSSRKQSDALSLNPRVRSFKRVAMDAYDEKRCWEQLRLCAAPPSSQASD